MHKTFVNIYEAKTNLSKLIQLVLRGEKVIIQKNNQPVAELTPSVSKEKRGGFGLLKDKIKIVGNWKSSDYMIQELMDN